jgi:TolB protein
VRRKGSEKGMGDRRAGLWCFLATGSGGVVRLAGLCAVFCLLLAGCATEATRLADVTATLPATTVVSPTPAPPTATPTATANPTATSTPSPTPTATPSPSPTPTATPPSGTDLLAFESVRDGNGEIYLLDSATGELTNVTRHPADDRAPAWRPDGGAIAFESHRDGNWEIYVLDLSDGSLDRLTDDLAYDGAPCWSPDGTEVAFESYRDGNLEIYVAGLEGAARRLTDDPAADMDPVWSPDGSQIAFTSWRDGNEEIYVVPAEGGQSRNVTEDPADDEDPAWTPDGTGLAFVSWRDVDAETGNRNAEIYRVSLVGGAAKRLTDNPWPDLDPAWDSEERLVWSAYDPGEPFETYDPYRPGDFHLYRSGADGAEQLTASEWDDRHPAPAPARVIPLEGLAEHLPPKPIAPTPVPTLAPGTLAEVVEVPSILASSGEQPILVNELVTPSLLALQQDILDASGWDLLHMTLGSWRSIDQVRKKEMYVYDYGFLSWHKTGRALDFPLEYKVNGVDQMVLVREDLGQGVYFRMYLRTAKQDGTQGEPLKDMPWTFWWRIVPDEEPEAYAAGGKRLPIPAGYYVDVTQIAKRHGWERIASYAIEGDYHWTSDSNATEYWHYERTDGLSWWEAMCQIYPLETLEEHVGWQVDLSKAQSEAMMVSKGVPTPGP